MELLLSWNLWLIPNSSPMPLSRPRAQAEHLCSVLTGYNPGGGLRVVCLQEAWAWHCGVLWPVAWIASFWPCGWGCTVTRHTGSLGVFLHDLIGFIFIATLLVVGWMFRPFASICPMLWNPRSIFKAPLRKAGMGHCIAIEPASICGILFDNGLCMYSSHAPIDSGSAALDAWYAVL